VAWIQELRTGDRYRGPMKSPSADDKHRSLVMSRRCWTAYFTLPFAIGLLIAGFGSALIAYDNFEGKFGIAVAGLCLFSTLCVGIPVGRSAWTALTNKEPALIVDASGITDYFHLNVFLQWSDMKSVSLDYGDGNCLSIVLRDGATTPDGTPVRQSVTRAIKRAFTGSDLKIPLGSLTYNPNKLRELLKHYMKIRARNSAKLRDA
jgi:hypothetical protein